MKGDTVIETDKLLAAEARCDAAYSRLSKIYKELEEAEHEYYLASVALDEAEAEVKR